ALLQFRPWLAGRRHFVESLAGADAEHDTSREHRAHGAERLGYDGRMVAERRRQHAGPHDHARRFGAQRAEPRQRERRVAVDVLPRLKVVADEDRVEADFLGKARGAQQLARRELLGRGLVSELDQRTSPWLAPVDTDAEVPLVEIYRLAANQQPAKARNDHASRTSPAFRRHRWRWPDRARIRRARRGRRLRWPDAGG